MVRLITFVAFLVFTLNHASAQISNVDSLKFELSRSANDTTQLLLLERIAYEYGEINPDSAYQYAVKVQPLARQLRLKLEEVFSLGEMGYALLNLGNYPRSLQALLSAISIAEDPRSEKNLLPAQYPPTDDYTDRTQTAHIQRLTKLSRAFQYTGILYGNSGNYEKALSYYLRAIPLGEEANNLKVLSLTWSTLGRTYFSLNKYDSGLACLQKALDLTSKANYNRYIGSILLNIGRVYLALNKQGKAKEYLWAALYESKEHEYFRGIVATSLLLSNIYLKSGNIDSSLYYIKNGLPVAYYLNAPDLLLRSYTAFSDFYKRTGNSDSIVKYQSLIIRINDSLFNSKQVQQFQNIDFDEQQRQQQIEAAKTAYKNKFRIYSLLAGLAIIFLIALLLWRNVRHKQRAYTLLMKQKQETDLQKSKAEQALSELKSAQNQLIQSEKMASLGELTAGIAHEIQNPLNFVNNFSEINRELITELKEELKAGHYEEADGIAEDIGANEAKINHHGKRADSIVKGMLEHSRTSGSVKEPTDINKVCDEFIRLGYHGFRVKDKSFNVEIVTNFDKSLSAEGIVVVAQDIGRLILNLVNNAFYAVHDKSKTSNDASYKPRVTVTTTKQKNSVLISIADNGSGIPDKIQEKIFQPFFTTKPTGQGTGLGLSLCYDIVKAQGGEIKMQSDSDGTIFTIQLPIG